MKITFEYNKMLANFEIVDDVTDISALREKVREMTNIQDDSLVLSFMDIDNEEMVLKDNYDFEYFVENARENIQISMVMVKSLGHQEEVLIDRGFRDIELSSDKECKTGAVLDDLCIKESKPYADNVYNDFPKTLTITNTMNQETHIDLNELIHSNNDKRLISIDTIINDEKNAADLIVSNCSFKQLDDNPKFVNKKVEAKNSAYVDSNPRSLAKNDDDIDEYLDTKEQDGYNNMIFNSGRIDFVKDISAIFPRKNIHMSNDTDNYYHHTNSFDNTTKNIPDPEDKVNRDDKITESADLQTKLNLLGEHTDFIKNLNQSHRIVSIESKLDILKELFIDSIGSIREEIHSSAIVLRNQAVTTSIEPFRSSITTNPSFVNCDHCKQKGIAGKRYKCLECWDYDICESCEARNVHSHPMVRMTTTDNSMDVIELNKYYRARKTIDSKADNAVKEDLLRLLTKSDYGNEFYKRMVESYQDQSVEKFIGDMLKIFT